MNQDQLPEVPASKVGCIVCLGELNPITVANQGGLVGVPDEKVIAQVCMNQQCHLFGILTVVGRKLAPEAAQKAPEPAK